MEKTLDRQGRWRSKTVAFRVSPEENNQLEMKVRLSGLTKQDYIVSRLTDREIRVVGNPRVYKALKNQMADIYAELQRLTSAQEVTPDMLEKYISDLHQEYKPKTVKRKIASIKALFHYLEYKESISTNPFNKMQIKFRESIILPKTIPLHTLETLLSTIYQQRACAKTDYQKKKALQDIAVIELLFATGIRISELCALRDNDVDLYDGTILIYGKGSKERIVQIGNKDVLRVLIEYHNNYLPQIQGSNQFFTTQNGAALSDQAVRSERNILHWLLLINTLRRICSGTHLQPVS